MAALIASGITDTASADFTLTTDSATIYLVDAAGTAVTPLSAADIQIKAASLEYFTIATLTIANPAYVLSGAGTYRVVRFASATAFGVDKN